MKQRKNNIYTQGYFVKRLKDNGFIVLRMFQGYSYADPRRWTVLVDPGGASVFITCYENKEFKGDIMFEINDGGRLFPKNLSIKTDSLEVIVSALVSKGITQSDETNSFYKPKSNGKQRGQAEEGAQA